MNMTLYNVYAEGLDERKTNDAFSFPSKHIEGDCWNEDKTICYSVNIHGRVGWSKCGGSSPTSYIFRS